MARHRRAAISEPQPLLRQRLAAHYRELLDWYAHPLDAAELSPWPALIARLDAGEPVEVNGWEVSNYLDRGAPSPAPYDRLRIEADGSLTTLKKAR